MIKLTPFEDVSQDNTYSYQIAIQLSSWSIADNSIGTKRAHHDVLCQTCQCGVQIIDNNSEKQYNGIYVGLRCHGNGTSLSNRLK